MLLFVAIVALLVVTTAFVTVAVNNRTIPFSPGVWASGKGKFTEDNPRRRMEDELISKLNDKLTKKQVQAMLGATEERFSITTKGGGLNVASSMTRPAWYYLMGVRPKTPTQERAILILTMNFDNRGRVTTAYVDSVDYPEGSTVGPYKNFVAPKPGVPTSSSTPATPVVGP